MGSRGGDGSLLCAVDVVILWPFLLSPFLEVVEGVGSHALGYAQGGTIMKKKKLVAFGKGMRGVRR